MAHSDASASGVLMHESSRAGSHMPKVSVLTPIYNTNIQYLKEMIESVLNQTFSDFEFLILNDSPENLELDRVVQAYQRKDSRIRYLKNDVNLGISESRNRLLKESKGEYLAILDHDDVCAPERLKKEAEYLDKHPEVGVVGTWAGIIGKGRPLHFPERNIDIKRALLHECVISHSSSMLRKKVMVKNKIQWEEEYSPSEDFMLWAKLFPYTLFHNIPEELLKWRVHEGSSGDKMRSLMKEKAEFVRSYLQRQYPAFLRCDKWIYLFNIIPFVKIYERGSMDTRYLLFGVFPLYKKKSLLGALRK